MPRIERPAIQTNIRAEPMELDVALRRIMARLAQTLERPEPKPIHIATMRLNVIADFRRRDDATLEAELAQRVFEELVPPNSSPAGRAVPLIPLCRPTADAHGSN
jgi:hypothetical protein